LTLIFHISACKCTICLKRYQNGNRIESSEQQDSNPRPSDPMAAGSNQVRGNFLQCLFLAAIVLMALYGCRSDNP